MKYLIYLRVSTDKQDVEMQNTMIFNYLKNKHREEPFTYQVFSDSDTSSGIPMLKREGLQEMLRNVTRGAIVLVYKLDRLSRDILEMVSIYRQITRECGASVHSLNDPYCDDFSVGLMGVLAEKERADTRAKTRDALKNKKEKGERYSRHLPYGYTMHKTAKVPVKVGHEIVYKPGLLVQESEEQKALDRMRQLFEAGNSYQEIVKILTLEGYRNRAGKPFHKMSIYRILVRIAHARSAGQLQEELATPQSR